MKKIVLFASVLLLALSSCSFESNSSNPSNTESTNSSINLYTITWKNYDGSILEIDNDVEYGSIPHYDGETPTRESDEQYHYSFNQWSPSLKTVTEDAIYTALFDSYVNTYTVTWKNYDGYVLEVDQNVPYGSDPQYDGETPTKSGNSQYSYVFSNWSPKVEEVTGDITYIAEFKPIVNVYTVTWKNYDGSVLEVDEDVPYGTMPSYDGETPIKEKDAENTYYFSGWSPELSEVTGDVTYTAQYESEINKYTVIWKNYDGSVLEIDEDVPYGTMPSYDGETPIREDNPLFSSNFLGWSPEISEVTCDITYTAVYEYHYFATEISLNIDDLTLYNGRSFQLECTISPDNTYDKTITYLSSNSEIVSVTQYGFITANSDGDAVITAKASNGLIAQANIHVVTPTIKIDNPQNKVFLFPNNTINLISSTTHLNQAESVWNSSNPSVATVDQNGVVTAVSEGIVDITLANDGYSDSLTLYVINSDEDQFNLGMEFALTEDGEHYTLTKYSGTDTDIYIPKHYNGKAVIGIKGSAFYNYSSLSSIYIPNSIITIGSYAFYNCYNLEKVIWEENSQLSIIGDYSFSKCDSLTSITFSKSLTMVGKHAFEDSSNLTIYFEVPSSALFSWDENWSSPGVAVFWNCIGGGIYNSLQYTIHRDTDGSKYLIIEDYVGNASTVTVPSKIEHDGEDLPVIEISSYAFYYNSDIKKVTIQYGVTTIRSNAFYYCDWLFSVYLPASITTIENWAFHICDYTTVYIAYGTNMDNWDERWNGTSEVKKYL